MNVTLNTKFSIKQEVYHITPESPKGIVIDISYSFHKNKLIYLVAWNHEDEDWYAELELSETKSF